MYNIAIIITTFLRDELLYKTLQSIVDNYPENSIVLVGDQSNYSLEKEKIINSFKEKIPLEYYKLDYDCGLSSARNQLVSIANDMLIPYVLISADSIQFTQKYDFQPYIDFLEKDNKRGLIGYNLLGSKCPWEWWLDITPQGIKLNSSNMFIEENDITYKKCEICRNIFLAKTKSILNLWDNEMKLAEHELAFLEYKKRGYEVYWTNSISFNKVKDTSLESYNQLRNRFGEYKELLKKKLNITGWVVYSSEAMREIKEYKAKQGEL